MINTDPKKIEYIVTRGVERIFPHEDFLRKRLESGERLTVYLGIDPTGPTLHMGHVIPLIKLSQLQELGHQIILLIGDFTARIGDPDKNNVRKQLTHQEVLENAKRYQEQASLLLNFEGENPAEFRYNGTWLDRMNFADVITLASQITVQQMLNRDMFKKRFFGSIECEHCGNTFSVKNHESTYEDQAKSKEFIGELTCPQCHKKNTKKNTKKEQSPIYLHEFMYPLMQGYDSVAMNVDGEVGGNDQTFNMLVGRDLMKNLNPPKEKFVIPMKLLVDNQGQKMGKTTGNMLSFLDSPDQKFKKIMTWSDDMMVNAFELLTDIDLVSVQQRIDAQENPRDIKFDLALNIVSKFHGKDQALDAKKRWLKEVQQEAIPEDIPEVNNKDNVIDTLVSATQESRSQVRRLIKEQAVRINGEVLTLETNTLHKGDKVQVGKKRWYSIT